MSHSMVPYIIKLCLAFSAISTIMFASAGVPDGAAGWTFGVMDCVAKVLSGHLG